MASKVISFSPSKVKWRKITTIFSVSIDFLKISNRTHVEQGSYFSIVICKQKATIRIWWTFYKHEKKTDKGSKRCLWWNILSMSFITLLYGFLLLSLLQMIQTYIVVLLTYATLTLPRRLSVCLSMNQRIVEAGFPPSDLHTGGERRRSFPRLALGYTCMVWRGWLKHTYSDKIKIPLKDVF